MYKFLILFALSSGLVSAENLSFQQSLNMSTDRISALDVINGAGDISIRSHESNDIQVTATITSKKYRSMAQLKEVFARDMILQLDRESEYAVLRGHSKPNLRKNPEILIHLDILIPEDLDVDIDDGSGAISVTELTGYVEIDDGSGSIEINRVSNNIDIDDGSGDILISQSKGAIDIDDGSGDITITDSHGDINIDDGSGDIKLLNVNGNKEIADGSGDITVKNSAGEVDIDDGSGDIMLEDIVGSVVINDGSGSIYIDALDGSLNIKNAGSGKVIIDGENRSKEF